MEEFTPMLVIALVISLLAIAGMIWCHLLEKKAWNGGRCSRHGAVWMHVDTNSKGDRGYKCGCRELCYIWISWFADRA